jgi:glycolate oxidase iron-sulfur subunit
LFSSGKQRGFSYGVLRLVLKHVWLHPARLKLAFGLSRTMRNAGVPRLLVRTGIAKLVSRKFEFSLALLASSAEHSSKPWDKSIPIATIEGEARKDAMLFRGCVGEGLFSRVNRATRRVLQANGFAVVTPERQGCCGALHAHAGDLEGARILARKNIEAFASDSDAPIITNAGGCGAMLASYGHLLTDDKAFGERASLFSGRVRDVSQQLATVDSIRTIASTEAKLPLNEKESRGCEKVTYDSSCHLLYGQHAGEAPLSMLRAIPQLDFARLEGSERCCGGAGIYNLLEPNLSQKVLEEKLRNIKATGANTLATGNPGCQMQIGAGAMLAGMDLVVCHPVELLDEAYARAGIYEKKVTSDIL